MHHMLRDTHMRTGVKEIIAMTIEMRYLYTQSCVRDIAAFEQSKERDVFGSHLRDIIATLLRNDNAHTLYTKNYVRHLINNFFTAGSRLAKQVEIVYEIVNEVRPLDDQLPRK